MSSGSAIVDIGGSAVKVTVFIADTAETLTSEVSVMPSANGRHIYLNPNELLRDIFTAMNDCVLKAKVPIEIEQLYISSLRQGFCLISKDSEVTPIFLNSDTSGALAKSAIEDYGFSKVYAETGHWFAPQLTLPKLINLKKTNPSLFDHEVLLLFVHDWLVWRLTGRHLTEMTLVSAGQMARIKNKDIHRELLHYFGLPSTILPEVSTFGAEAGSLNKISAQNLDAAWSGVRVLVGGGDSHFLHMGASGNSDGRVVVSAGSSTPISLLSRDLADTSELQPWKSTSFASDKYFLEGNLGYPGSYFGWLKRHVKEQIDLPIVRSEDLALAPMVFGSCNLWSEEKWESRPPFSILGDFSKCSSNDLAMGLTLDYAFSLHNQISCLIRDGFQVNSVVLTGGGANANLQLMLQSLLALPIYRLSTESALRNLFRLLGGATAQEIDEGVLAPNLLAGLSDELRIKAAEHARIYSEIEGSRDVLLNAK